MIYSEQKWLNATANLLDRAARLGLLLSGAAATISITVKFLSAM